MDGTLDEANGRCRLRFARRLDHSPETVWRALTEGDDLAAWFPAAIEGGWGPGSHLTFTFHDPEEAAEHLEVDEAPVMHGEVIAHEPHRHLEYTWAEDTLRFDLEATEDGGTLLTLTVLFDEIGKAARDASGWHECLDLLAARLAGQPPDFDQGQRWAQVHPRYVQRFGAEASAIGPPQP